MKLLKNLNLIMVALAGLAISLSAEEKPNILLIVADDMGYGDLSCYGSLQIKTPHLDKLAANGVRCTDGYVSGSVCAPSRAGLMTGRYGSRFGFEHNLKKPDYIKPEYAGIPLEEKLISDRMKALGYRTGMVGKWHLGESVPGHHPNARGFDFFFGMLAGVHDYFPTAEENDLDLNGEKVTEIRVPYLTDWFTLEAIDFINNEGKAKTKLASEDQPWFLYLSYNTPHSPMQAKEEDMKLYEGIFPKTRQIYCAMQHNMDENIGKVVELLKKNNELENTLIVFISDNGGSVEVSYAVNAPYRGTKGTFLEGGIRVPTIYHWPAKLKPGVYKKPVISLDFLATFEAAAGAKPSVSPVGKKTKKGKPAPIYDSVNLIPYFTGEKGDESPHEALYWRTVMRGGAMRYGDWKFIVPASSEPQLYNLAEDPGELKNLFREYPELVEKLYKMRLDWEVTFERNSMFASAPYWNKYNYNLYRKVYSLEQPKPDNKVNIWKFKVPEE